MKKTIPTFSDDSDSSILKVDSNGKILVKYEIDDFIKWLLQKGAIKEDFIIEAIREEFLKVED